jgi:hypothetical protein
MASEKAKTLPQQPYPSRGRIWRKRFAVGHMNCTSSEAGYDVDDWLRAEAEVIHSAAKNNDGCLIPDPGT